MRVRFRTARPKTLLIVSACVVVLAALALVVAVFDLNAEVVDINGTNISDIEYLPVMPGAYNIRPSERGPLSWESLGFNLYTDTTHIFQFYKATLPARGWRLTYESPNDAYMPTQTYYWEDPQDHTPYVRTLDVSNEPSAIWLTLARIPILDKTPLYPGAQNVEKKEQCIHIPEPDGLCEVPQTLITYKVHANRQEVDDYYTSTLTEYGWWYGGEAADDSSDAYIKDSLLFGWGMGGVERVGVGASVSLLATDFADGWTTVDLDLRGDDKYSPVVNLDP